jgi:thioesterase domain-containing protein/acyl carrier protein
LERDDLGVRDDFFELGGHSILALKLVGRIRSQFGKTVPLPQLFKNPTVEKLAETLRGDNASLESQPIVRMSHGGSGLPIFLLPGAGGNVLYLYELAKRLGPGRPVYGLQAVGLDGVTPLLASVEEIAQYNIERIREEQPDGPYILVGHSFGGKVAFEMSRRLFASGRQVGMLAILDTPAPVFQPISDREDWDDAQWLIQMARELEEFLGIKVPMTYQELKALPEDEQLDLVIKRIEATGWWPPGGDRSQLRGCLQVFKTSVRIDSNFRIDYENLRDLPPTPIVLIKASTGGEAVSNPELAALFEEEAWGWDKLSPEPVRIHQVAGDHITMMSEGRAENVAEKLRASLAQLRLN